MKGCNIYRIIGIDPSSQHMGMAVIDVDVDTYRAVVVHSETLHGSKLMLQYPHIIETHGEKEARMFAQRIAFEKTFDRWEPNGVAIESPFLGRFPAAFASLTLCVEAVRNALIAHNYLLPLNQVDPPTVKNAVGVIGRSKEKEDIRKALAELEHLTFSNAVDLSLLDEHSCDANAVAYWLFLKTFNIEWKVIKEEKRVKVRKRKRSRRS